MSDTYHHGNLREALIEEGIRIINESGEDALSLRKVASACNVSHAAPYAHFKDKDELIEAIKESVTEQLMAKMEDAVNAAANSETAIVGMGKRYVSFFRGKPDYFKFLFGRQNITAHLRIDEKGDDDYPPFVLLKETYLKYLKENGIKKSRKKKEVELLKIWASAHGLAAIACMSGVIPSFDWDEMLEGDDLLR
ncbi:MAG: TetR/AcrR family transcriptional regulator [Lachnospiraceae bacterium]|nr:TetR/AcrR family transcriptional regulator [Lachnospiraceae bacterium]